MLIETQRKLEIFRVPSFAGSYIHNDGVLQTLIVVENCQATLARKKEARNIALLYALTVHLLIKLTH